MPEAVAALAHAFTAETGIRTQVRSTGQARLEPSQEEDVVRIVAEALANVRRHAGATDVEVSIAATGRQLRLAITDNGRGFNPRARTDGFGVVGMRERAQALGGRLQVSARRGSTRSPTRSGARIVLTMPLESPTRIAETARIAKTAGNP